MELLTTTVGSFPKPRALKRARRQFREGQIDGAALRQEEDLAVADTIALQERLGLSILTDGEMTREDLVGHYAGRLDGLEEGMLVRCWGNRYVRRPRVTSPIGRPAPILVEDWKKAQRHTERPVRAIVTGPYTLMHWSYDEHYGSREACARAFCTAIAEEVAELAAAGATEIQLDEPALGVFPEETAWATELIGEIGARRATARLWLYVAFGDPNPDWKALVRLPIDCLMIGLAHQGLAPAAGPALLPSNLTLAVGVIDTIEPELESARVVRERVEQVMKHVPAARLILATDGGLRGLAPEIAEAKAGLLVETASAFQHRFT